MAVPLGTIQSKFHDPKHEIKPTQRVRMWPSSARWHHFSWMMSLVVFVASKIIGWSKHSCFFTGTPRSNCLQLLISAKIRIHSRIFSFVHPSKTSRLSLGAVNYLGGDGAHLELCLTNQLLNSPHAIKSTFNTFISLRSSVFSFKNVGVLWRKEKAAAGMEPMTSRFRSKRADQYQIFIKKIDRLESIWSSWLKRQFYNQSSFQYHCDMLTNWYYIIKSSRTGQSGSKHPKWNHQKLFSSSGVR